MSETSGRIPDLTLETLSRTFYTEATKYGFTHVDYVRYVNRLLDMAMKGSPGTTEGGAPAVGQGDDSGQHDEVDESVELPLRGEGVVVRRFDPEKDLPLFDRWLAELSGRYFLLSRITTERQDIREVAASDSSHLGIITLPDSTPIGSVAFLDHDLVHRKAELRKMIGDPKYRRKGFATQASALWIRYGIQALGLKKIYVNTLNANIGNIKLNEDLGFKLEGILRNEVFIDGAHRDVLRMGLWHD
jgi:RimJ/RimL family protein N-acetyltransferase